MMAATPIGVLAGGALIETSGIRMALAVQLIAMLFAIAWMALSPTLRKIDQ